MATEPARTARLSYNGVEIDLPVIEGSIGPNVIDVRGLYRATGCFTFDPGFTSTGSCSSAITYIDGEKGELLYRGYPIEELGKHAKYVEVCFLLLYGHLPTRAEYDDFAGRVTVHTMLHEQMQHFFPRLPARCPSHGHHVRRCRRPRGVLSRLPGHRAGGSARDRLDSHDLQDADHRRMGLQVFRGAAVHIPAKRSRLRVQLPAHVLCGSLRDIRGQPRACQSDGPHFHAARRPRAKRLHFNGAACGQFRRQSVRLHRRRRGVPLGTSAWRRERGVPEHASRDRHTGPDRRVHQTRQGPETTPTG